MNESGTASHPRALGFTQGIPWSSVFARPAVWYREQVVVLTKRPASGAWELVEVGRMVVIGYIA
jgi:hypothetical protein